MENYLNTKKKDETNQEETKIVFLTKNAHCLQTW